MGSLLMRGNRATADTFLTAKMRYAGLNFIGRTTTPEFGICSSADNPEVYVTRNPWNTDYTTCGSPTVALPRCRRRRADCASDRRGRFDPHSRLCQWQHRAEGFARVFCSRCIYPIWLRLVSIQGCQSRTVRDTAVVKVDRRGPAPGEFTLCSGPQPNPSAETIRRDPGRLEIALSHQWGDYRATPHIAAELERVGRFLEGSGHRVDHASPSLDYREASLRQTTCYIRHSPSPTPQTCLRRGGWELPPADLVEPVNIRIWEAGRHATFAERAKMQAGTHHPSRGFGAFFEQWDIILTPITALPTPKVGTTEYLTISDNPSVVDQPAIYGATSPSRRSPICAASSRSIAARSARERLAARHPGDREAGR